MDCQNHDEVMDLVSDIVQVFNRMDDGLGVRMDAIIRFTVMSLHLMGAATFFDIYHAMTDEKFRQRIREHPAIQKNSYLKKFWTDQAEKLIKGESGAAIAISRMTRIVLSPAFQTILGTPNAPFRFADAIENKKIILVRLKPNSDEAMLYGSLIVSKIQQAIFRRTKKTPPFMLYVDEFQDFRSSGFEKILSQAGGLGLYLTIANQYFDQLDPETRGAIINNVSTYFLFRMGTENARHLAGELKEPPAPPTPDIKALKEKIKSAQQQEDFWGEQEGGGHEAQICFDARLKLEAQLREAERPLPERLTFLEKLPYLPKGQAVYRAADGTTAIIKTPAPPPHTSQVGKTSHADYIKSETLRIYGPKEDPSAEFGTKRVIPSEPCNSGTTTHTEGNDQEPQHGAAPSHERREKRKP
jgi:hypothetical protein